jgi:hypothetical protein
LAAAAQEGARGSLDLQLSSDTFDIARGKLADRFTSTVNAQLAMFMKFSRLQFDGSLPRRGASTIAQQFTAGLAVVAIARPVGTTEMPAASSLVPPGRSWRDHFGPSDKSLGYCRVSLRDTLRDTHRFESFTQSLNIKPTH